VKANSSDTNFPAQEKRGTRPAVAVFIVMMVLALGATGALLFGDLSKQMSGILVILLSIILLLMGIPVGVAMLGAALLGLYSLAGLRVVTSSMKSVAFDSVASWSYSVIPMFILMGMILWKSGLTSNAFEAARRWFGWMPGGLAVATNTAGAVLAASSGSTIGITFALGRVSIPEMLKSGYDPRLAVGSVAAAGTLGQIIPPSLLLVIYAGAASTPVGLQLLAGFVPGLLLAGSFSAMIIIRAMVTPGLAPAVDMSGITWRMRMASLLDIAPIGIVILCVVGGIFAGIFTATEAGVYGMIASLIFGSASMLMRGQGPRDVLVMMRESLLGALTGTAAVFLLIIGIAVLTRAMALSQLPNTIAGLILDLGLGKTELLLLLILVYLFLGMFMDTLAMMLLTIPVLLSPLQAVGVDPLWFGVFLVVMAEVGLLTPPLGILSFVVHRIASDPAANLGRPISLPQVFAGIAPFAVTAMAFLLLLIAFPEIATWLPETRLSR